MCTNRSTVTCTCTWKIKSEKRIKSTGIKKVLIFISAERLLQILFNFSCKILINFECCITSKSFKTNVSYSLQKEILSTLHLEELNIFYTFFYFLYENYTDVCFHILFKKNMWIYMSSAEWHYYPGKLERNIDVQWRFELANYVRKLYTWRHTCSVINALYYRASCIFVKIKKKQTNLRFYAN